MTVTPTRWGSEITVTTDTLGESPQVQGLADDSFTFVWDNTTDIFGRHVSPLGMLVGSDFLSGIDGLDGHSHSNVKLIQETGGATVVDYDFLFSAGDHDIVWAQPNVNGPLVTTNNPTISNGADTFFMDNTATANGASAIAFQSPVANTNDFITTLEFLNTSGDSTSGPLVVAARAGATQDNAAIAGLPNGNVVVAYEDFNDADGERDVRMQIWEPNGALSVGATILSGSSGKSAGEPDVTVLKDGSFVVVWQDVNGIELRHVAQNGTPDANVITVGGSEQGGIPKITALNDGGFVLAWLQAMGTEGNGNPDFDLELQSFSLSGGTINQVGLITHVDEPGSQGIRGFSLSTLTDGRVVLGYSTETGDSTGVSKLVYQIFDPRDKTITGTAAADTIVGRQDGSSISGLAGNDSLVGSAVADTLDGGTGVDTMTGGAGDDIYFVDNAADVVVEAAGGGSDTVNASSSTYTLAANVERLTGTLNTGQYLIGNATADTITGGNGANNIYAGTGALYAVGGSGGSVIVGSANADSLYGGAGNDYIVGNAGNDTIVGYDGINSLYGGAGNDYIVAGNGAGSVVDGGAGANTLWAGSGADYMVGGEGADLIVGEGGSDYLFGNAGNDTLYGGQGTDYIYGNSGNDFIWTDDVGQPQSGDFVYEGGGTGVDTVADFTPGGTVSHDTLVIAKAATGISTFAQIQAHTTQVGVYSVISLSATDQVYLYNVQPFQLTANDFLFL